MSRFPASCLLTSVLCLLLSACSMPTEPEGIGQEGLTRIGAQLQGKGDDAGAADFYQRALQRKPDDLQALRALAGILEAHGNVEAANGFYDRALKVAPDNHDLLYAKGRVLIKMGRADEARKTYQQLLDDNSDDIKALNGLGVSYDFLGQHEEAKNAFQQALKISPDNLVTLNNLAHSYILMERYNDAITLLEPHALDKTISPDMRQNLAKAYGMEGKLVDAERLSRVDLKPDEVKRNIAFYRDHQAKIAAASGLTAYLGIFPTSLMAEARATEARNHLSDPAASLSITTEVDAIGGIPRFILYAHGFSDTHSLDSFCAGLIKENLICKKGRGP